MDQKAGPAATLAIAAGIGSFIATFTAHPGWGLILAILAVPLGLIGMIMAASPRVSGGIMSIFSIVLGLVGAVVALLGVVGVILF